MQDQKSLQSELTQVLRLVPDFPKKGILFRDISTLLGDPVLLRSVVKNMADTWRSSNVHKVAGMESRGFLIGILLAQELGVPFLMIRKANKLPLEKESISYGLEYGKDVLEVIKRDVKSEELILIVDDLLATGGTAKAAYDLLSKCGAHVVGFTFIIELDELHGRRAISDHISSDPSIGKISPSNSFYSVVHYP
jgi:adenine phosphoribosyltransferase